MGLWRIVVQKALPPLLPTPPAEEPEAQQPSDFSTPTSATVLANAQMKSQNPGMNNGKNTEKTQKIQKPQKNKKHTNPRKTKNTQKTQKNRFSHLSNGTQTSQN